MSDLVQYRLTECLLINIVSAYREAGKEEAATRLEDQSSLIHTKFQELSGKF